MSQSETKDKVLLAAGPIFAEKGFRDATVREICQSAGVNLASVNYHFGDKEQLYIAAVRRAAALRQQHAPMPDWPEGTTPEAKLRDFIRTLLRRMLERSDTPWQTRLMLREILDPTSACREWVTDYFEPLFQLLLEILNGLLPEQTSTERRHKIAFSIIGQCLFYRVSEKVVALLESPETLSAHFGIESLADHIYSLTIAALRESAVPQVPTVT